MKSQKLIQAGIVLKERNSNVWEMTKPGAPGCCVVFPLIQAENLEEAEKKAEKLLENTGKTL